MSALTENRVKEDYVASVCAKSIGCDYWVTPDNAEYDFQLITNKDIKVFGEIKCRAKLFSDWFIAAKKAAFLKSICELTRCNPWYVIYCEENGNIYKLNLFEDYTVYREDWMTTYSDGQPISEWGQFVGLDEWQVINASKSTNTKMTPIDWK